MHTQGFLASLIQHHALTTNVKQGNVPWAQVRCLRRPSPSQSIMHEWAPEASYMSSLCI